MKKTKEIKKWSQTEVKSLMFLKKTGHSTKETAKRLGRSEKATEQRFYFERVKAEGKHNIGQTLRMLRTLRGMTQLELAEKIGMWPNHLGNLENNKMRFSDLAVQRICNGLDVKVEDFWAFVRKTRMCEKSILRKIGV